MKTIKMLDRRVGFVIAVCALLLAAILPTIAGAAQLTERSIALSSSSAAATGVSYDIEFTTANSAGAFVVDFCENSPIIGQACTSPAGLDVTNVSTAASGFTVQDIDSNTLAVTGSVDGTVSVLLDGIDNPTNAGVLYARVVTYDTELNALAYATVNPTDAESGRVDDGGAALSITDTIGVSGAVLESMTFCVSGASILENCTVTGDAPTLRLGETEGTTVALNANNVSEGSIYTQISTNAASGAVISLKSNATDCGGLLRAGASVGTCNIGPADATGITAGQAEFGVKTNLATNTGAEAVGVLQPAAGSSYNNDTFFMNFVTGNLTGVTSPFGDPFLDTDSQPANNKNMEITFGASVSNNTPAGLYSADLRLIATGKF